MPWWWKGKLKGKLKGNLKVKSKISAASEPNLIRGDDWGKEEESEFSRTPERRWESTKERIGSFDGVLVGKNVTDVVSGVRYEESGEEFAFGHPLPLPSSSSPLPSPPLADTRTAGAFDKGSSSSVSSSESSEDSSHSGSYRLINTMNARSNGHESPDPKRHNYVADQKRRFSCSPVLEHPWNFESPVSPGKEIRSSRASYPEFFLNSRRVCNDPSMLGSPLSLSPLHPLRTRSYAGSSSGRNEELKSPPHPLPLPPTSPISPSSFRSFQMQWKKGKLLGRGTFGRVYLGFNSDSGQMCAIKEVTAISEDSISRESLKQLNQEISLLSQLSHRSIVQYYGSELADETLAVYLEYVSGGSIHKLLQEYGPFGEPVVRNYTAQILSGLAYLHGRNTVHRDIKGANILVDPNGKVKLADFGMAKHISSFTSIRSFKGSPYWMAPEVIMNGSGYNLSVDIWSLGCTVLEMATSKPPWSQFEGVAAIFKIGNSKDIPDIPNFLSSEAKSFLRLCLLRDPSARPTAAQLMDHPFVCDQFSIKAYKSSMMGVLHSFSDRSNLMTNNSVSPYKKENGHVHQVSNPIRQKNPSCSDLIAMGVNISLQGSPSSTPLRLFEPCNHITYKQSHVRRANSGPRNCSFKSDLQTF